MNVEPKGEKKENQSLSLSSRPSPPPIHPSILLLRITEPPGMVGMIKKYKNRKNKKETVHNL